MIIGTKTAIGFGLTFANPPTATLHLAAGSATAGTAPLKLTSGTVLATPEAGAIEFNNDTYSATITTGPARKTFAFLEGPVFTAPPVLPGYTVGTLPTPTVGMRAYVTNALGPIYGAPVAAGGTVTIPVFYDGTNWITA
jgi:hypothetical protein